MSEFWEKKYQEGSVRCRGSRGALKRWKHEIMNLYAGKVHKRSLIDVGCGDARFWKWRRKPQPYWGIDPSATALKDARKVIPHGTFIKALGSEPQLIRADIVISMDVFFHLMTRKEVSEQIENMCRWSEEWIFIYNWIDEPEEYDKSFQAFWDLSEYEDLFKFLGFRGQFMHRRMDLDKIGAMYVYERREVLY